MDKNSNLSVPRIGEEERKQRLARLRAQMDANGIAGVFLGSTNNLRYFTGLVWSQSERLTGALITQDRLVYIAPGFERSRLETMPKIEGDIAVWEEDEDSAALVATLFSRQGRLALDDALPLFAYHALARSIGAANLVDGAELLHGQRIRKSSSEIAIIQYAMDLTLGVHKSVHAMLRPGTRASEVVEFIDREHRRLGSDSGSTFCIVSFGEATTLPHGANDDQVLEPGDAILVDTGCRIDGYNSDITRTYVLDEPAPEFARYWTLERQAQQAVFDAAKLGAKCSDLDDAVRNLLSKNGLGPDYSLPGLPHRAGHGVGLEGHEHPYIVRGNSRRLEAGMCFSNEPMIVIPHKFGIRLEDHIYMTNEGAQWFTFPSVSPTEPFA